MREYRQSVRLSSSAGDTRDTGHIPVVLGRFSALVGHGLRQVLLKDQRIRIVGRDLDGAALEHVVAREAPRVAVLNETTAIELSMLERLRATHPEIGIVVLAHRPTLAYAMGLLRAGASCLSKDLSAADIVTAVHVAADGRRVFTSTDGHMVERSYPALAAPLTPREAEVLEYLSRGCTNAEIAHALQVSVETIKTHSASIRGKFGVRSKRELSGLPVPNKSTNKDH